MPPALWPPVMKTLPASLLPRENKKTILAAAFALILTIGAVYFLGSGWPSKESSNGNGSDESPGYMYYTGPVFPLSLEEADGDISSERNIHFDFSPFRDRAEMYIKSLSALKYAVRNVWSVTVTYSPIIPVRKRLCRFCIPLQPVSTAARM